VELSPYIESLRHDLAAAAAAGGEQSRETAALLSAALEPAVRLCLVDALSALAAEVTTALDGPSVELRMRGREPQVVVVGAPDDERHLPPFPPPPPAPPDAPPPPGGWEPEPELARVTVRLPEKLKVKAEESATAERLSLNAWIVRAIATAVGSPTTAGARATRSPGSRRLTGFARS
jgi:HicB family